MYNNKGCIGVIADLSQVFLAIYDIPIESVTYTGSENIDITNNQIWLNLPLTVNGEIVMNPRSGGVYFEIYAVLRGYSSTKHCGWNATISNYEFNRQVYRIRWRY